MAADLSTFNDLEAEFKRSSSTLPTRITAISTHESDPGGWRSGRFGASLPPRHARFGAVPLQIGHKLN